MSPSTRGAVVALEPRWREVLDGVARAHGFPTSHDFKALGAAVARLSEHYNGLTDRIEAPQALAARLSFSFVRDTPKSACALTGLVGELAARTGPLRVLDLGAGLGATTWGVVRALSAAGYRGTVEATLVDQDRQALALAARVATAAQGEGEVRVQVRTQPGDAGRPPAQPADLVVIGQALSEMHTGTASDDRAEQHAALLHGLLSQQVAPDGALVVVEPALRERTRHLHLVRGRLIARGWSVFAPCLHDQTCPMLANEHDWCHEDRPIDLPDWLVPVARAAGLRFEGLTFSYLVLRPDRRALRGLVPPGALRVVSVPRRTKGKREADLCGEPAGERLLHAVRLDRDARPGNAPWEDLARGDLVVPTPPLPLERPRVSPEHTIERHEAGP